MQETSLSPFPHLSLSHTHTRWLAQLIDKTKMTQSHKERYDIINNNNGIDM